MSDENGGSSTVDRAIVIDCDPGQDDAIALVLACRTSEIAERLAFVSTVAGNSPADVTHRNGRRVVEFATDGVDLTVPVHRGADRSLAYRVVPYFSSDDELPGWSGPEPIAPVPDTSSVEALVGLARERPARTVTVCVTGPLTNIALALLVDPSVADSLRSVVWMGGGVGRGNITPAAEFNAYVDPEALSVVLASGVDLTVVPAEIGETATIDGPTLEEIESQGSPAADAVARLIRAMGDDIDRDRYARLGRPMYDPTVIAFVARPQMFDTVRTSLVVDTDSGPSYGATHFDLDGRTDAEPNCTLVRSIDAGDFRRYVIETLRPR